MVLQILLVLLFLVVIASVIMVSSVYVVRQQSVAIIERFGKYQKLSNSGIHLRAPFGIDRIAARVQLRLLQSEIVVETKTQDNVFVTMNVATQYRVNENNVKIKLTGTEKGAPIKGELIETERESGENTKVISVEYYNGKYTYSDEKTANELWPQQSFLFQKITLNKDFLSTLKLKDKYYSSMNGSFELNYDVNLPEINEYLSFPASKSIELSFGGSNSNRNYYYSVVIEDKDGYYFRETVYE